MEVDLSQVQDLRGELQFAAYAALDATGTREVYDVLRPRLNENQLRTYRWNLAQQSPALTMALRGVKVDQEARDAAVKKVTEELDVALAAIGANSLVADAWDGTELDTGPCRLGGITKGGNQQKHAWPKGPAGVKLPTKGMVCKRCGGPRERPVKFEATSNAQIMHLLYDILRVPIVTNKEGRPTCDDDALQYIINNEYVWDIKDESTAKKATLQRRKRLPGLAEFCEAVLNVRDGVKQLGFLKARLSPAGRFHSSFNVAAPWTGRWSSSKNPYRLGGNLQNIGEQHRNIFVADAGKELFYADLKTAESLLVAYKSGDTGYIEAHKKDVHTYVCREIWPELPWTGDDKKDKEVAKSLRPPWDDVDGHDYRFQAKRVQHGSNYGLSPLGMALISKIPVKHAKEAQNKYFEAFPRIREWQAWTRARIEAQVPLYNALRREVRLMGRPWDGHTHKQGYSFDAQSGVGDILNTGLWRVWRFCDTTQEQGNVQLLAQVHDAILGQYPAADREVALQALRTLMAVEVEIVDIGGISRVCTIPVEIACGVNWGKWSEVNPKGLKEV